MSLSKTSIRGTGPGQALNWARNGIAPSGGSVKNLGSYINGVIAGRKKVPFSKSVDVSVWNLGTSDYAVWRFAHHTGPFTTSVRAEVISVLSDETLSASQGYYWNMTQALDGSGTSTDHPSVLWLEWGDAATITPADWRLSSQDLTVAPDTDYVWTLYSLDGRRILNATVWEKPTHSIPAGTTGAIETGGMGWGQATKAAQVGAIIDGADLLWKRGGKHIFSWTEYAGVSRTTATAANIFDQTLTGMGSWTAKTPGFPTRQAYMGSLDSDDVACTLCCYAKQATSGTGVIRLLHDGEYLAAIDVTSTTGAWVSTTFNLSSAALTDKVDLQLEGDGTHATTIYSASAWAHVA